VWEEFGAIHRNLKKDIRRWKKSVGDFLIKGNS